MINLRNQSGRRVDVKVGATVTAGTPCRTSGIIGIPVDHCLNGNTVTFITDGIVALTLAIGGTLAAGCYLYWDTSAALLSLGADAGDVEFGQILGADPEAVATVYLVKLNIGFPRAAAGNAQN